MKITKTLLAGVSILEPVVHGDERGWFMESYAERTLSALGITCHFVQDNHSYSRQHGVLRGIHYQKAEAAQAKLVRCLAGAVYDVAVDLNPASPTYKQWVAVTLSAENKLAFFIPKGYGHAFQTLTDDVEFFYKVDAPYQPEAEGSVRWDDPELAISWPVAEPLLSAKDSAAPSLAEFHRGVKS
jgi:dTDP-4-dehydrorhamnose 3,5-epimerase